MSVANILKTDQKHLAAALLNMKNASLFIKQVNWDAAIKVCEKPVKRETFKTDVLKLVNGSSVQGLNEQNLRRLVASLLYMNDVDTALEKVEWAKASASAAGKTRGSLIEVERATVTRLVSEYKASLEEDDEDKGDEDGEEDDDDDNDENDVQFLGERAVTIVNEQIERYTMRPAIPFLEYDSDESSDQENLFVSER